MILVTNTLALSLFTYIFGLEKLNKAQIKTVYICTRELLTWTAILITESKQQGVDTDLNFS